MRGEAALVVLTLAVPTSAFQVAGPSLALRGAAPVAAVQGHKCHVPSMKAAAVQTSTVASTIANMKAQLKKSIVTPWLALPIVARVATILVGALVAALVYRLVSDVFKEEDPPPPEPLVTGKDLADGAFAVFSFAAEASAAAASKAFDVVSSAGDDAPPAAATTTIEAATAKGEETREVTPPENEAPATSSKQVASSERGAGFKNFLDSINKSVQSRQKEAGK